MKVTFTDTEKEWLNEKLKGALLVAGIRGEAKLMRVLSKMRYKFEPNAPYVHLTGKDRVLLAELVKYRIQSLGRTSISPELDTLSGIANKLLLKVEDK
jgi:hypothetical protein